MKEEFVDHSDVEEVVPEPGMQEHVEEVEIDMRNNSIGYMDQHTDSVFFIAKHPTQPLIVSGGGDNQALLWDASSNGEAKLLGKLPFSESVTTGGFTKDGKWLVLGDMNGQVQIFGVNGMNVQQICETDKLDEEIAIVFHPAWPMFAVLPHSGEIWCYELTAEGGGGIVNVIVLAFHTDVPTAVFTDPTNANLFSASQDGTARLWDASQGKAIYTIDQLKLGGEFPFVSVVLSPERRAVALGSIDGQLFLVKVADGNVLKNVDTTSRTTKAVEAQAEMKLLTGPSKPQTSEEEDDEIVNYEDESLGTSLEAMAWRGNLLATGNVDGEITIFDVVSFRPRTHLQMQDAVTKLAFDDSGLLCASSMDASVAVFDLKSGNKVYECLGHSEGVLDFVVQNGRIYTAGDDGICLVYAITSQ